MLSFAIQWVASIFLRLKTYKIQSEKRKIYYINNNSKYDILNS